MKMEEIRTRMHAMAAELAVLGKELHKLAAATERRKAVRRAPVRSAKMTPVLAQKIRQRAVMHPNETQQEIAAVFHVSSGRVSEVLAGKRT